MKAIRTTYQFICIWVTLYSSYEITYKLHTGYIVLEYTITCYRKQDSLSVNKCKEINAELQVNQKSLQKKKEKELLRNIRKKKERSIN